MAAMGAMKRGKKMMAKKAPVPPPQAGKKAVQKNMGPKDPEEIPMAKFMGSKTKSKKMPAEAKMKAAANRRPRNRGRS